MRFHTIVHWRSSITLRFMVQAACCLEVSKLIEDDAFVCPK